MLASGAEPANLVGDAFGRFIRQELDKWTRIEMLSANNPAETKR